MPIVQSSGGLKSFTTQTLSWSTASQPSWSTSAFLGSDYGSIYATQPNIRKCVEFLARNLAQLGIHAFRRVSDTDRVRLAGHDVERWFAHPNPAKCRYRFIEDTMSDLGIYFRAYWAKLRSIDDATGRRVVSMVRIPPYEVEPVGGLLPSYYAWRGATMQVDFDPRDLVVMNGYNPLNPLCGLPPIETLRQILEEQAAANQHRAAYWNNSSRMEGVIERPKDAPKWTATQKEQWREQWAARYTGPANAGKMPVLEDGMTWKPISGHAKDSEYSDVRKLSGEECAAAYHIPLPLVGILEHATFSNIKEQHKMLYADTLGPWCEWISEEIELQVLPESPDADDVYIEFNIAEKLKGSFEEQAAALQSMVGRPVMTANEGRARLNLPRITNDPSADQLAAQQGGPATSTARVLEGEVVSVTPSRDVEALVRGNWRRQADRLRRLPAAKRADELNASRCVRELAVDLVPYLGAHAFPYAARITTETYGLLRQGADPFVDTREVPPCPATP